MNKYSFNRQVGFYRKRNLFQSKNEPDDMAAGNGDTAPDESFDEGGADKDAAVRDNITGMGSVITHRGDDVIYCLTVIGQIE